MTESATVRGHPTTDADSGAGADSGADRGDGATDGFAPLGRLSVPGAKELVVDGTTAYVAATDGFAVVDVSDPAEPVILTERRGLLADHTEGPLVSIYDGAVGGERFAVGGPGRETAGAFEAAVVYDVSDPTAPERVTTYQTDGYLHNLDVDGETLYLCGNDGDRNPLICVDVATGAELGRWSVLDEDERWGAVDPRLREIHDVRVVDGVAYVANWNAGTWLVDVSDPQTPEAVVGLRGLDPDVQASIEGREAVRRARFGLPGNDHFAVPRRGGDDDLIALNEEAWGATPDAPTSDLGGVELWDAVAGERLARIAAPPTPDATYDGVWTTPHNFDFVGDRLYTSWYRGGVTIHDVAEPTDPEEVAHWRDANTTAFWTAQRAANCTVASSWRDPSAVHPEANAAVYTFPAGADRSADRPQPVTDGPGRGLGPLAGAVGLLAGAVARRLSGV